MSEFYNIPDLKEERLIEIINYVTMKPEKTIRASELQLKYLWGYHRAGRTLEVLEKLGIISEFKGISDRKVLMTNKEAIDAVDAIF